MLLLADISVSHPENYLFTLWKKHFLDQRIQKNILFNFENGNTVRERTLRKPGRKFAGFFASQICVRLMQCSPETNLYLLSSGSNFRKVVCFSQPSYSPHERVWIRANTQPLLPRARVQINFAERSICKTICYAQYSLCEEGPPALARWCPEYCWTTE